MRNRCDTVCMQNSDSLFFAGSHVYRSHNLSLTVSWRRVVAHIATWSSHRLDRGKIVHCLFLYPNYCTSLSSIQPRRISAISVAERVAYEREEELGESTGYSVRFESFFPRHYGSIFFCTVGKLWLPLLVSALPWKHSLGCSVCPQHVWKYVHDCFLWHCTNIWLLTAQLCVRRCFAEKACEWSGWDLPCHHWWDSWERH